MPNYLNAPVLIGSKAYVPSKQDNIRGGSYRGFAGMTFDQTRARGDLGGRSRVAHASRPRCGSTTTTRASRRAPL